MTEGREMLDKFTRVRDAINAVCEAEGVRVMTREGDETISILMAEDCRYMWFDTFARFPNDEPIQVTLMDLGE